MFDHVLTHHIFMPWGREEGSVWPIASGPVEVTTSWRVLREENQVLNHFVSLGWWAEIGLRYLNIAMEENERIRDMVDAELGRSGP